MTAGGKSGDYPTPQASGVIATGWQFYGGIAAAGQSISLQTLTASKSLVGLMAVSFGLWIYRASNLPANQGGYNPYLMQVRSATTAVAYALDIQNPAGSTSQSAPIDMAIGNTFHLSTPPATITILRRTTLR